MSNAINPSVVNPDGTRTRQMPLADKPPGLYVQMVTRGETAGEVHPEGVAPTHGAGSVALRDANGDLPDSGLKRVHPPSADFDWLPFSVYKDRQGNYTTDLDVKSLRVPTTETYYCSPYGDDANDGLTAETPKKSVGLLVDSLNATPPAGGATIMLAPGLYNGDDALGGRSIDFPCNLVCPNGTATFATLHEIQQQDWIPHATVENAWSTSPNPDGIVRSAIDLTVLDEYGNPKRMVIVTGGHPELAATPGSISAGSSQFAIHTFDSQKPSESVRIIGTTGYGWNQKTHQQLYAEGIRIWGHHIPLLIDCPNGMSQMVFSRCSFAFGTANGVEVRGTNGAANQTTVMFIRCQAHYNREDGFGYRYHARVVEIDCLGTWNGGNGWKAGPTASNQGSTIHNNVRCLRVSGTYRHNNDRNISDVNLSRSWLVGCVAGDALEATVSSNFNCGTWGGSHAAEMWLDGCRSTGGSVSDVLASGTSVVRMTDCDGMTIRNTSGTGIIEDVWQ